MKTQKIEKRLTLSKETITNLEINEMNMVIGGSTRLATDCIGCVTVGTVCSICCP